MWQINCLNLESWNGEILVSEGYPGGKVAYFCSTNVPLLWVFGFPAGQYSINATQSGQYLGENGWPHRERQKPTERDRENIFFFFFFTINTYALYDIWQL